MPGKIWFVLRVKNEIYHYDVSKKDLCNPLIQFFLVIYYNEEILQ